MTSPAYMTVVFEFKNEDDRRNKTLEFAPYLFSDDDSEPMRVTTISGQDEATKLELVEFGLEVGDIEWIRTVFRKSDLSEQIEVMQKCRAFANEKSCAISSAYERLHNV